MKNVKIAEYLEKMQNAVETILSDDRFKRYLQSLAMFRKYSFANTLLIFLQKPDAKRVAGVKTWNKLGRHVKKGEHGIAIFVPRFRKKTEDVEAEADTAPADKPQERRLTGFLMRYVFDVSQTYGENISLEEFEASSAHAGLDIPAAEGLFARIISSCPVPVEFQDLPYNGDYAPGLRRIRLNRTLTALQRPRTLIHEIAHLMAIDAKEHLLVADDRPMSEVIAEGAAFVVCSYYGLDTSAYSFAYIAAWGKDMKLILSWGNAVMRIANKLIELIGSEPSDQRMAA